MIYGSCRRAHCSSRFFSTKSLRLFVVTFHEDSHVRAKSTRLRKRRSNTLEVRYPEFRADRTDEDGIYSQVYEEAI